MKYSGTVILTLVVMIGIIGGVYYYFHGYNDKPKTDIVLTTAAELQTTTKQKSEKKLLASDKKNDFALYKQGENILLTHGGYTKKFSGWSNYIEKEKPTLYYSDLNDDGTKELSIKLVSGTYVENSREQYYYDLYILTPKKQSDGSFDYHISVADRDTWKNPFNSLIKCNARQLTNDKSRIQVVMANADETISYDAKTGITTAKHVGYSRCESNKQGKYYDLYKWDKGAGEYFVDGKKIKVKIQIRGAFSDQKIIKVIGYIYCGLTFDGKSFSITPNSIYYESAPDYKVSDPRKTAKNDWSYTIHNYSAAGSTTDIDINWIDTTFDIPNSEKETKTSFLPLNSEIKSVDTVKITNKKIVLTAKKGYSFIKGNIDTNDFAAYINNGKKDTLRISSTASVSEKDKLSVLTIKLDKSYPRSELKKITIKYGA